MKKQYKKCKRLDEYSIIYRIYYKYIGCHITHWKYRRAEKKWIRGAAQLIAKQIDKEELAKILKGERI